jgi:hypothetical protein
MRCELLFAFLLVMLVPVSVCAWGATGHHVTAAIAEAHLSPQAVKATYVLLGEGVNLTTIASWADTTARTLYPWSEPLHFVDVQDAARSYVRARDCLVTGKGCVDTSLGNYTTRTDEAGTSTDAQTMALKFVVHFAGDIHQPLHVAYAGDRGGNTLHGTFVCEQNKHHGNLHQMWDTTLLEYHIQQDFSESIDTFVSYLVSNASAIAGNDWSVCNKTPHTTITLGAPSPVPPCTQTWAEETFELALAYAYTDTNGQRLTNNFVLSDAYYQRAVPILEQQLTRGGLRLAALLNNLWTDEEEKIPREE